MNKNWKSHFREAFSREAILEQFHHSSHLARIFFFSFVGALVLGVMYNFVSQNSSSTRASGTFVTATVSAPKTQVALNEEFLVVFNMRQMENKLLSQSDLRFTFPVSETTGDANYVSVASSKVGSEGTETDYFNSTILEESTTEAGLKKVRVVLSSRKPDAERSSFVQVRLEFKATKNGKITYTLDKNNKEIVGPNAADATQPISYTVSDNSSPLSTEITVGTGPSATQGPTATTGPSPATAPSATMIPSATMAPTSTYIPALPQATPTITIAPPPSCAGAMGESLPLAMCNNSKEVSMIYQYTNSIV